MPAPALSLDAHGALTTRPGPVPTLEPSRNTFLRKASHELRTPLNAVLGFADIMANELYGPLGSPSYRDCAEIILSSGQRLLTIIDQVVELARLEADAADLTLGPVPLDSVLDDVLDLCDQNIRASGIEIEVKGRGNLATVVADPRGLATVLNNLILNTCYHAGQGAHLSISARPQNDGLWLDLADNGVGISAPDIARLPFEQGEAGHARQGLGAGLGLSITDHLCRVMQGDLHLAQTPGGGLTARVRLPLFRG